MLPERVPQSLRDPRRLVPAVLAVALVVGLAVYLPSRSGTKGPPRARLTGGGLAASPSPGAGGTETAAAPAPTAAAPGGTGRGGARARAAGGVRGPGSPAAPGAVNRFSYQGVTDTEVRLVVAYQHEPCGQDPSAILQKALPSADPEGSIATAMAWFNEDPRRALGDELPPAVRDALGKGYYGRVVKHVVVDDHGDFCAEQSRNDAKVALSTYKPFAVLGGGDEWDDEVSAQKVVKVTGKPALDSYFLNRRPYLWGPITGASQINRFLAGYTARFLKDSPSTDTGDPRTARRPRVFGIVFLDDEETRRIVADLRGQLARRGVSVKDRAVVGYEPNLATIGVQARNIVAQLMGEGVTSILMVMDPIAVQFIAQAADNQRWYPEWISNTYGLMDWSLGPRSFMSREQARNTFGISVYWPSRQIREEETEEYRVWKAKNPSKDVPSDWLLWYRSFKLIFRGIALAGSELTPATFERGYNRWCAPCARSDPFLPLIGYGPGDFTAVDDAHRQRYDPDAPDYAAPRSSWQGGQPPQGAYVYEDGGRRWTSFD